MTLATVDPRSGETLEVYPALSNEALEGKLALARTAFLVHRRTGYGDRAAKMVRVAELLEAEKSSLARTMTLEMGKPVVAARAEVEKCAWVCRHYAEAAPSYLADAPAPSTAKRSFIRYEPLGVVLAVMPWNFPLWQVFRFAAPALMAGNVGLLKHASNVQRCAAAIESLFVRAGFAPGAFQNLRIGSEAVGGVIADERIAAVTLTGSERAGESVGAAAGRHLKKCVLELGGSDPFIVLASADVARAAATAVKARTINNGQSCIAAKRFIVVNAVFEAFLERFVAGMSALKLGDPLEEPTEVGPLATASIRDELHVQVQRSVAAGARCLLGGERPPGAGFFYPPTVLLDPPRGSPARDDELFGPVASVFRVTDADEALNIANETKFGLGASVWTDDAAERERFISELEAGSVFVNGMVASDPRLPFGGIKRSGYGRELAEHGIREFTNVKTVWLDG